MRIGILGAGRMGRARGLGWARGGHEVLFGARDRRSQLVEAVADCVRFQILALRRGPYTTISLRAVAGP